MKDEFYKEGFNLPVGDIDSCRNALEMIKRVKELSPEKPTDELLAYFFSYALRPFYDCMWDGMKAELGHIIYNLSDLVSEEQRKIFMVYPNGHKSGGWDTLEDFRQEWKSQNVVIPNLLHLLRGEEKFLLGK